ncbi:MAG: thioredoxin family protein [Planctomycetota bacterium]|jgi:thiol:disulfide interchange protein DsbD|nr:thioredoxin family protein [Planctomycetota bacterium]
MASLFILSLALALHPRQARTGDFNLDFGTPGDGFPDTGISQRESPPLKAALLPEAPALVPGRPFRLLLELDHQPGAYSYWVNPGGPGLAARIDWQLPAGFAVSPAKWPTPELYVNSGIASHILKGKTALVYTVTPPADLPADGEPVHIIGVLDTQVCTGKSCIPSKLRLETTVTSQPAGSAPQPPVPALARALARLPAASADWRFEAAGEGREWLLSIIPSGPTVKAPAEPHFFEDGAAGFWIDSQQPQPLEKQGETWRLRLPRLKNLPPGKPRLSGVVRISAGPSGETAAVDIALPLPEPSALVQKNPAGGGAILAFAFFGGLILNVMPCVFPVLGLKIMGFVRQAHSNRRLVFAHGAAYAAGAILCFWGLAVLVIGLDLGWGAQLQSELFLFALCHLFLILSMNMAGAFQVGVAIQDGRILANRHGLRRSFLTGLLATLTATPCSAPFLGSALAYALSAPAPLAFLAFTLMGLGFAFPYLALSAFPSLMKWLPKPGLWMETFRQIMSFPLFAATVYLAWMLEATLGEWRFLVMLQGLVLTALACWLHGRGQANRPTSPRLSLAFRIGAPLALATGVWIGLPTAEKGLEWREWSPEMVRRLRGEGKPVYVDFTARWCATCQINQRVWLDRDLIAMVENKKVELLKADWTLQDERIAQTLRQEFAKAAVPLDVLYAPGEKDGRVLPDLLTVGAVMEALAGLPD